jgi:hypothetical protein
VVILGKNKDIFGIWELMGWKNSMGGILGREGKWLLISLTLMGDYGGYGRFLNFANAQLWITEGTEDTKDTEDSSS